MGGAVTPVVAVAIEEGAEGVGEGNFGAGSSSCASTDCSQSSVRSAQQPDQPVRIDMSVLATMTR